MKIAAVALLVFTLAVSAGLVEFGAHGGLLIPSGDGADFFSTSYVLGANVLVHMPIYAVEGSIGYGILQTDSSYTDFSASLIPVLAGIRTYAGPIFYGGGAGMYISSVSYSGYDESESDFGAYGNLGMILPTGSMDLEGSVKFHLVDFDFDKAWIGLTVGTYF